MLAFAVPVAVRLATANFMDPEPSSSKMFGRKVSKAYGGHPLLDLNQGV